MERNLFTFYRSFYESINFLPLEEQAKIYNAICEYALNGNDPNLENSLKSIFILIKPNLDASRKRAESGKKGGQVKDKQSESKPKQNESKPKQNESKPKQSESKPKQSESKPKPPASKIEREIENEIENEIELENKNEREIEKDIVIFSLSQNKFATCFPNKKIDCEIPEQINIDLLIEKITESAWLKSLTQPLSWHLKNYKQIIADYYKDNAKAKQKTKSDTVLEDAVKRLIPPIVN